MNVLSLFDGMSCGQIALQRSGIKIDNYFASEIDKHAIKVTMANFPDTIQLGDVTKVFAKDLPKIDLIIGGSPCQGFSFAGKGLNFDDPRSKLFFEFVRLVKECKPKYFFLENVKMKKEHELVISQYMGVAPIEINSALLSAQNRVRLYWTNINEKTYGLFDDKITDIPQPKDKGILLKDILDKEVDQKYFLSEKAMCYLSRTEMNQRFIQNETDNKGGCITANYQKGVPYNAMVVASRGRNPENPKSREAGLPTEQQLEPREDGKTNCLTSVQKDNWVAILTPKRTEFGKETRKKYESGEIKLMRTEITQLEPRTDNKTNTLSTVQKDNLVFTKNYLQYDVSGKGYKSQQDRAFYEDGKHGSLCAGRADNKTGVLLSAPEISIRRLTPLECERLQTVPDGYTNHVSDTQRYRMLGNGWTVDVIAHILSFIK